MLIGQLAKMANLSKDGIRHYEEMGLIVSTPRMAGQRVYRDYDLAVLERIEQIRQMQQLGFSLKEMGPILRAYEEFGPFPTETVVAFLEERLKVIRKRMDELQGVEAYISKKLAGYRADLTAGCGTGTVVNSGRRRRAVSAS
jgi:DNA-binding transcriptional MerR regulator